ncbi:MAG TPA: hypothetical protein VGE66_07485 [Chitinophagaceae bacterium]
MRKIILHLCAAIAVFSLVSCQKEVDTILAPTPNNPSNSTNYQPLTANSFWKYKDSLTGAVSQATVVNKTKLINSRNYTAALSTMAQRTDTSWMAVDGPNYFIYADVVSPNTGAPATLLFHYLNDTASVGYNWQYDAGHGNNFPAIVKTIIMERGITHTVEGKTYPDVIHTRLELNYNVMGTVMKFGTYDYYIAKGVGIVRTRTLIDVMGMTMESSSNLLEYQVK